MADIKELNQRIVYAGLSRMSPNRSEVQAGFSRWQEKFGQHDLDVFEIVADLVIYLGLGINEKKALMIGLHSASNKMFDELQAVPTVFFNKQSINTENLTAINQPLKSAHIDITERFFQLVCQYLQRSKKTAAEELAEIIEDESLPSSPTSMTSDLKEWGRNGLSKIDFPSDLNAEVCKSLAHDLYILLSEVAGPVEADTIINRVIDDLLKSDAAQTFSPRDLL